MQPTEIASLVSKNPELESRMKSDPAGTLKTMGAMPLATDVWIYRGVIGALGFTVSMCVVGGLLLAFYGKPTPEGVIAIGSTAMGAMAGLLAPSPK